MTDFLSLIDFKNVKELTYKELLLAHIEQLDDDIANSVPSTMILLGEAMIDGSSDYFQATVKCPTIGTAVGVLEIIKSNLILSGLFPEE